MDSPRVETVRFAVHHHPRSTPTSTSSSGSSSTTTSTSTTSTTLFYLVGDLVGDVQRPIVILLHGGGQTRHSWTSTAISLARHGYCALTLDLKGHGDSYWDPVADYTFSSMADDLVQVLSSDLLRNRRPALVGASMGGIVSLIAEAKESHASCIVLVDITPKMEDVGVDRIMSFMRSTMTTGFATVEEAIDAISAYQPHRKRSGNAETVKKNLRFDPSNGRYYWHWDPKWLQGRLDDPPPSMTVAQYRAKSEELLWKCCDLVSARKTPMYLIRGRSSDLISESVVKVFLEKVPSAQYVDVEGAAHMVAGDSNDVFTQALMSFLDDAREQQSSYPTPQLSSRSKL